MITNRADKLREIEARKEMIRGKLAAASARADRKLSLVHQLKARMMVCVLSLVFIVALTLTVFNVRIARSTVEDSLQESVMPVVDLISEVYETKMESYVSALEGIGQNSNLTNPMMPANVKEIILNSKKEELEYLSSTMTLYTSGEGKNINNEVRTSINELGYHISSPYYTSNGQFVFDISVPLLDTYTASVNGSTSVNTVGIVTFSFDPNILSQILETAVVGANSSVYVLNQEGVIVASLDYEKVESQSTTGYASHKTLAEVEKTMLKGERGNVVYRESVKDRILAYAPIESLNWTVGVDILEVDFAKKINDSRTWSFMIGMLLLAGCAVLVYIGTNMITKPVENLTYVAKEMARGNFDVRVEAKSSSEVGILAESLILTLQNLKSVIHDITRVMKSLENKDFDVYTEAVYVGEFKAIEDSITSVRDSVNSALRQIKIVGDEVSSGADQVATGAQSLAQGATEQASSIQELSATITEIYDVTKKNSILANTAAEKVGQAGTEIEASNAKMQQLMGAMSEMTDKSAEIGKIVKTIDDIAFQTNILALNAAVEAARAGAAGKGFAVVADEVRNLASKSAEAAKTTTNLIDETIRAIAQGTQIANETANALVSVVEIAQEAVNEVNEISLASETQNNAVGQITTGVDQISAVVQTNSATSEESAAAAEQLSGQAQSLDELLSQFNIQ